MRYIIPEHEKKLAEIIEPYLIYLPGLQGHKLKEDAPEKVRKAYEEFMKIVEEDRKHRYDPDWF